MTPNEIIEEVRRLEQDSELLRTPDSYIERVLLGFVQQTLLRTATLRPDLFAKLGDIPTQPDSVVQTLPADSLRLIEVFHVKGGNAVVEVSHSMMERSYPNWASEPSGQPVNYMRHPRNHNRYFLYPAPTAGVTLVADYAQVPPSYAPEDNIELLPTAYKPALVYGTAHLVATVLNDRTDMNRANLYNALYERVLGVSAQASEAVDSGEGRLPEDSRRSS